MQRPDLSRHLDAGAPPTPAPARTDWPEVASSHPWWWHVHRIEPSDRGERDVLIAEVARESDAIAIAIQQRSPARISRWNWKTKSLTALHFGNRGATKC
jgi:hypothetical protein